MRVVDFNQTMATGLTQFGTLKVFNSDVETITKYLDHVLLYFEANEVADVKRVPILLSSIGPITYSLICDLAAPENPKTLDLAYHTMEKNSRQFCRSFPG